MGRQGQRPFSKKWLILGFLAALFPLFQNMSPSDEFIDIRKEAPQRPAGRWNEPIAEYIPQSFSGHDLKDVEKSILSHNFDPLLKDLEVTYIRRGPSSFGGLESAGGADGSEAVAKWKLGLINPTKLRLSYEDQVAGRDLKLICESQVGRGLSLKMARPISTNMNVEFSHETSRQESQLQFDYRW